VRFSRGLPRAIGFSAFRRRVMPAMHGDLHAYFTDPPDRSGRPRAGAFRTRRSVRAGGRQPRFHRPSQGQQRVCPENSFSNTFLELAFVEVSSNGTDFFRFPNYSFTASPVSGFGNIDPTNIDGLAGKYRQGYGTPFDLDQLSGIAGLDVNRVQYVRLIDVVGNGSTFDSYPAAYGGPHPIYDPYPTSGSSGFDLDAVGVIHYAAFSAQTPPVPEPSQWAMYAAALGLLSVVVRRHRA